MMKKVLLSLGLFGIFSLLFVVVGYRFTSDFKRLNHLFLQAKSSYQMGLYNQASLFLNEYLESNHKNSDTVQQARYYLAASIMRNGGFDQFETRNFDTKIYRNIHENARQQFATCIKLNDSKNFYYQSIIDYATICRWYQRYDPFIVKRLKAITEFVQNKQLTNAAYTLLGYQYLYQPNLNNAMICFEKTTGDLSMIGNISIHLLLQEHQKAFALCEYFIAKRQTSIHYSNIQVLFITELHKQADVRYFSSTPKTSVPLYKKILQHYPNHPLTEYALFQLGELNTQEKHYTAALRRYQQVLLGRFTNLNDKALYQSALCEQKLENLLKAIHHLSQLLQKYPSSSLYQQAKEWITTLETQIQNSTTK